jgi:hypothetical protein
MKRHKDNTNLRLINGSKYKEYSVQGTHGPLIANYLDKAIETISLALEQHSKVFAFRIDLHFPSWFEQNDSSTNEHIRRFLGKLDAIIQANLKGEKHSSKLRYIWVREIGINQNIHYHLAILLNGNAYSTVGNPSLSNKNLFTRIVDAWARALDVEPQKIVSCVHIPKNAEYRLSRSSIEMADAFIHRISYLCKSKTKQYGTLSHSFGSSRG